MLHRLAIVALVAAAVTTVFSLEEYQFLSSCDERSVPYKININGHGKPEISCAQPSCLGDQYLSHDKRGSHVKHNAFNVTCQGYRDGQCAGEDQWVAGFMEVYTEGRKGNELVFKTKCCSYPGLVLATPVKTVVLQTDEEFTGGAYVRNEGLGGFDIIKEVRRRVMRNGMSRYEVTIVRMPCQLDDLDDYDQEPRGGRTGYAGGAVGPGRKSYPGYVRGALGRRQSLYRSPFRPFGFRRRNQIQDDYYYDYEEDFYQPRRRFELRGGRNRVRTGGNVLWPIAYKSNRARAYGADNEETTYDQIPEEIQLKASDEHPQMVLVVQKPQQKVQMPAYPASVSDSTYVNSQVGPSPPAPQQPVIQTVQEHPQQVQQPGYQEGPAAPQQPQQPPVIDGAVTYAPMVPPVPDFQMPQVAQGVQTAQTGYAVAPQQVVEAPVQQVYQQAYQPVQTSYGTSGGSCGSTCGCGGCMNSFLGAMQCFSGDVEVETTAGFKKMSELEVGDIVKSHDEGIVTYSPVIMFLHHLEKEHAEFYKITAEDRTLELTAEHLIYVSNCVPGENSRLIPARDLAVGNCVNFPTASGKLRNAAISQIDKVEKKGIYAPLTLTGDIIANGMLASCHSNLGVKILQQSFFSTYRSLSDFFYRVTSMEMFTYGKQLPTVVPFLTGVMDLFLPHSFL